MTGPQRAAAEQRDPRPVARTARLWGAAEVIDGSQSRVFDQAENRLHAQKALLYLLLG